MAELAPRERLQPSLLDRLTDDEPNKTAEPRERRVLSLRSLREGVLRDLAWLLNTTSLLSVVELDTLPHVANSVLNYGVPHLSGHSIVNLDLSRLERAIRQAIWDFEPRLIRSTVTVRAVAGGSAEHNKLTFEIEADMWAQPYPERLFLKTELDLEAGAVTLVDTARSGA
ncbi:MULTISPECIES: type VI secretion system baseplate subunit TssE [unclassified Massilia]|uniref:type VI secretion system baseplate subunit TssE n=1 Tax=unclassified Massilia TaxID=2609279 RepID=UPI00177D7AD2|nr:MULTISPECIES: type VI secretion system baseplate subunit TssE [unclassified Massilia]MBD8528362.1 type VI secretion system baseplate subunit TssE [Massilia sp. CFBP 13647]MBD8672016.1 type VI secretion system baseplate subunit TssE [Massilia sp. CFBP 13721]